MHIFLALYRFSREAGRKVPKGPYKAHPGTGAQGGVFHALFLPGSLPKPDSLHLTSSCKRLLIALAFALKSTVAKRMT